MPTNEESEREIRLVSLRFKTATPGNACEPCHQGRRIGARGISLSASLQIPRVYPFQTYAKNAEKILTSSYRFREDPYGVLRRTISL